MVLALEGNGGVHGSINKVGDNFSRWKALPCRKPVLAAERATEAAIAEPAFFYIGLGELKMAEEEDRKYDTPEEYIGYLAGSTYMLYNRMMNINITLEALRKSCGEPLLDLILEYVETTMGKTLDIQVAAGELNAMHMEQAKKENNQ